MWINFQTLLKTNNIAKFNLFVELMFRIISKPMFIFFKFILFFVLEHVKLVHYYKFGLLILNLVNCLGKV